MNERYIFDVADDLLYTYSFINNINTYLYNKSSTVPKYISFVRLSFSTYFV